MAKKKSSMKALKSLFSKSEANLDERVKDEDRNKVEKKKFKFFKLKTKSKSNVSLSDLPADEMISAAEPYKTAENEAALLDTSSPVRKRSSLYGTTSRSKDKDYSYSELDVRKPKRFATFSFGFKKKKRKDEDNFSKSTIGLNSPDVEEQEEDHMDLSEVDLDRAKMKGTLSMSQPELDSSHTFDIPSPPPVAINQSEAYFPFINQSQTYPEAQKSLDDNSDRYTAIQKAPIITIPELQLDEQGVEENDDVFDPPISYHNSSAVTLPIETISAVDTWDAPNLPESQLQTLGKLELKPADSDSVFVGDGLSNDDDVLQQSDTKADVSLTESTDVTNACDTADGKTPTTEFLQACLDSKIESALPESYRVGHTDSSTPNADSATVHHEVSVSCDEKSIPETANGVTATVSSAGNGGNGMPLPNPTTVYKAFYESLFPLSFASEDSNSGLAEKSHHDTNSAPSLVKTINERNAETNYIDSSVSTSAVFQSATPKMDEEDGYTVNLTKTNVVCSSDRPSTVTGSRNYTYNTLYESLFPQNFTSQQSLLTSDPPQLRYAAQTDIHHPDLPSSLNSDTLSHINDTVRSTFEVQNSAPPIFDYVTSQETQVNDPKRKVVLIRESLANETSAGPGFPSSEPETVSAVNVTEMKTLPISSPQLNRHDTSCSQVYLQSDSSSSIQDIVSSGTEIQISAPPIYDYATSPGTDTQINDAKQRVIIVSKSVTNETGDPGCSSPVPETVSAMECLDIKTETTETETFSVPSAQIDGYVVPCSPTYLSLGSEESSATEHYYSAEEDNAEERQGNGTSKNFVECFGMQQEDKELTKGWPHMKEEGKEEWEEGLVATPVQQVNTPMECESAPPSSNPHESGEGSERNWTTNMHCLGTEDHRKIQTQLPNQETQYLPYKDIRSSEYTCTASGNTRESYVITPTFREAEKQVLLNREIGKMECIAANDSCTDCTKPAGTNGGGGSHYTVTDTSGGVEVVTGTLTHTAEVQSDATEFEHNRAAQSSEGVDTVTQSTQRTSAAQEQVAFELSLPAAHTQQPVTQAADTLPERDHQPGAQPDLSQGSLRTGAFVSEIQQTKADLESADKMNLGYSSLSTTLSIKSSSLPKESNDESKHRFRKVSLVTEADTGELSRETVNLSTKNTTSESNGTDLGYEEYKWKNRFEGITQFKTQKTQESSLSDSLNSKILNTNPSTSPLSSSELPKATLYTENHTDSTFSTHSPEEHISLSNSLSDTTKVYQSHESGPAGAAASKDEWRRSFREEVEPAAPAGEGDGQREGEGEKIKSHGGSQQLPVTGSSSARQTSHDNTDSFKEDDFSSSLFTGVFKATRVELVSEPAAPPSTPPSSPDAESPYQCDMDTLVDTLKNMGPSQRPRSMRGPPQSLLSSLPPIVEDAPNIGTLNSSPSRTSPIKTMPSPGGEASNGLYTLPADLGLKWSSFREIRSPMDMIKQNSQEQPGTRGLNIPLRDPDSPEDSSLRNGNGVLKSPGTGSRLDNSVIFGSYRSTSIDQSPENRKTHRSVFRASSLPELGVPSNDRMSVGPKELSGTGTGTDLMGPRYERFSFLLNTPSLLNGAEDPNAYMSRPLQISLNSSPTSNSPTSLLSPVGSIDLHRSFSSTDSPLAMFSPTQGSAGVGTGILSTPVLQRSFSSESALAAQQTSLFSSVLEGSSFQSQEPAPERNLLSKYRAFPDAYLTKEKEHGKLNPRPGKMYIFDRPGMSGQRIEIRGDVVDATPWELQETISIRVVRGGWVLYEKPHFKGEKIALDEGDIEITCPFPPPEEQLQNEENGAQIGAGQNGEQNGDGKKDEQTENKPARKFIIGSVRRAVRDYSVPEISFFPEENAEGKKVVFRDTSDDARIFGFPIKARSLIVNHGLWLVYAQPFFQGVPRVLEIGGYPTPAAWGVEQPLVASLHPLKIGEPRVEFMSEPQIVIYEKPYFHGKSRTIRTNMKNFMIRSDSQQTAFMYSLGSLKVLGGIWVGYEKEGFRGHQYVLEEGEYHDWRLWGGCDSELRSVRLIRADLSDPMMVMFEQPDEEPEETQEENTFEVTEAIPDVELFGFRTSTRSIHVLSGAWIAYSHVDFSGNQYILEKGFYSNCGDWGSEDNRICSVQPILLAAPESSRSRNEILLYTQPDFKGECHIFNRNQEALPDKLVTKSCRVAGGSWVLYDSKKYSGNLYVLSEGDYPSFTSMGCPPNCVIHSVKSVPLMFSVPSISLFGLECMEGREITTDTEMLSLIEEGFNNHVLAVRVNSGCWVICEHSNYRGRQVLLEPIEISNWPKFSSMDTIGSMYPVRQKRHLFRIKNKERGHYMSVQGGVEELKTGRVVVAPNVEPLSDIWYYQDGLVKNKISPVMSLQVMGNAEPAAKVVLWSETRQPIQMWTVQKRGNVVNLTFPGMVLDVKGGKTYDKDHVVVMPENEERPSQQWEIELL